MHYGDMGVWGWWMMAVMPLMWLGLPALIAWAVWRAGRPRGVTASPLDLVKDRYARGEITREEFHQAKRDLALTGSGGRSHAEVAGGPIARKEEDS